jgi:hypothetical protein
MPLRAFPQNSTPDNYMYIKIRDDVIITTFNDDTDSTDIWGDVHKRKKKSLLEKVDKVIADENDLLTIIIIWLLMKSIEDAFENEKIDRITIEDEELLTIIDVASRRLMMAI